MLPTNVPSLKTWHLNVCFLGWLHISLVLETSLKNRYFPEPPAYINETSIADDDNPNNIFNIKSNRERAK